jgi:hypothetical protein
MNAALKPEAIRCKGAPTEPKIGAYRRVRPNLGVSLLKKIGAFPKGLVNLDENRSLALGFDLHHKIR